MLDSIGRCFVIFTRSCSLIFPRDNSNMGIKKHLPRFTEEGVFSLNAFLERIADGKIEDEVVASPVSIANIDVFEYPAITCLPVGDAEW